MDKLIAVLDDEQDIVELIEINLKKSGFSVKGYNHPDDFIAGINKKVPDLILLDLMLPGQDGFDICRNLQRDPKFESVPIIIISAKSDETDKVLGLELGADDYITKPFSVKELVARVKTVLRRLKKSNNAIQAIIKIGGNIRIDKNRFEVLVDDKKIDLTSTEFQILRILAEKSGWVFSREQLLDKLWGREKYVVDRTIDVHIHHLREKMGSAGKAIKNIRGVGYKIE